jgi:IstB-like ATP binding protein
MRLGRRTSVCSSSRRVTLGHHACRHGHTVTFAKPDRLLADLAGGHADRTWTTRLNRWARPTLLILGDFAMRDFTPTQADDLYDYADYRIMPTTAPGGRALGATHPRPRNCVDVGAVLLSDDRRRLLTKSLPRRNTLR